MSNVIELKLLTDINDGKRQMKKGETHPFKIDEGKRLLRLRPKCVERPPAAEMLSDDSYSAEEKDDHVKEITKIPGVSDVVADALFEAGYLTVNDIAEAKPKDLTKINGIGSKSAPKIVSAAQDFLDE